jgi:hypothetical protein
MGLADEYERRSRATDDRPMPRVDPLFHRPPLFGKAKASRRCAPAASGGPDGPRPRGDEMAGVWPIAGRCDPRVRGRGDLRASPGTTSPPPARTFSRAERRADDATAGACVPSWAPEFLQALAKDAARAWNHAEALVYNRLGNRSARASEVESRAPRLRAYARGDRDPESRSKVRTNSGAPEFVQAKSRGGRTHRSS